MSKNFITLPSTSRLPNRSPFCFQNLWVKRGYSGFEPIAMRLSHILCLKKFQVPGLKFKVIILRAFPLVYYSLSNKLYERCVVVILNRVLMLFVLLILRTYSTSFWWRIRESNPWPSACKADALANWANPPGFLSFKFQVSSSRLCSGWSYPLLELLTLNLELTFL